MNPKIAILILAAGNSKRMGTPKQVLPWRNTTLLGNAIEQAILTTEKDIFVILGANYELIEKEIKKYPIKILNNKNWELGLGNSIAFGSKHIQKKDCYDGVLIMLADQPFINGDYLNLLLNSFKNTPKPIVASKFKDVIGVPTIFDTCYLPELCQSSDGLGAKSLLHKHTINVKAIPINSFFIDVDTPADYKKYLNLK